MNRFAKPSNFNSKIRTPLLRQHFVYRAYNKAGTLLYVGCSIRVRTRLTEHKVSGHDWVYRVARLKVSGPYTYEVARDLERRAIWTESPRENAQAPGYRARAAA